MTLNWCGEAEPYKRMGFCLVRSKPLQGASPRRFNVAQRFLELQCVLFICRSSSFFGKTLSCLSFIFPGQSQLGLPAGAHFPHVGRPRPPAFQSFPSAFAVRDPLIGCHRSRGRLATTGNLCHSALHPACLRGIYYYLSPHAPNPKQNTSSTRRGTLSPQPHAATVVPGSVWCEADARWAPERRPRRPAGRTQRSARTAGSPPSELRNRLLGSGVLSDCVVFFLSRASSHRSLLCSVPLGAFVVEAALVPACVCFQDGSCVGTRLPHLFPAPPAVRAPLARCLGNRMCP